VKQANEVKGALEEGGRKGGGSLSSLLVILDLLEDLSRVQVEDLRVESSRQRGS